MRKWHIGAAVASYLLVNLPLVYVLFSGHSADVTFAIVGHAPNQFLFLLVFFPVAVYAALKLHELVVALSDHLVGAGARSAWLKRRARGLLAVLSLCIGVLVADSDGRITPSDIYQWDAPAVAQAILLNRDIVLAWEAGVKDDEPAQAARIAQMRALQDANGKPRKGDTGLLWLESIELGVAVAASAYFIFLVYLLLKLNGIVNRQADAAVRERLHTEVRRGIPYGIVFASAILFWPPLRLYNIEEIRLVVDQYETISPYYAYCFVSVLAVGLIWLYIAKLHAGIWEKTLAIVPLIFSGGILGLTGLTPQSMVYVFGSGMGVANVVVIGLLIATALLFGNEIWRQASDGKRKGEVRPTP